MELKGKTILIISPQPWSSMYVSKHHYAIELAKMGNIIYFLVPSSLACNKKILIEQLDDYSNINIIHPQRRRIELVRFYCRSLYKLIIKNKINSLLKAINFEFDVVLSFDNTGKYPDLSIFRAQCNLFFPVDQINIKHLNEYKNFGKNIFSISPVILDSFKSHNSRKVLINHGLGDSWVDVANKSPNLFIEKDNINVGYFGNLAMGKSLDMETLKEVISTNSHIKFHFWGNYECSNQLEKEITSWIFFLKNAVNVQLYGAVKPKQLTTQIDCIDAFILCYDYNFEMNKCSNSHKILEYLSTGKIIISSKITAFENTDGLTAMLKDFNNSEYINLFRDTIRKVEFYNSIKLQTSRKEFALKNTYFNQIEVIESYLE